MQYSSVARATIKVPAPRACACGQFQATRLLPIAEVRLRSSHCDFGGRNWPVRMPLLGPASELVLAFSGTTEAIP